MLYRERKWHDIQYFSQNQRGVQIRRLITDNAITYSIAGLLRRVSELGGPPAVHPALSPQTNGKAERFIQPLLREWAHRVP
jgi:transposase InsO family protein